MTPPAPNWPRWHAGRRLTATDLHGLEDFCLARAAMLDPAGPGLDLFDSEQGLRQSGSELVLSGPLRGVAVGDAPVALTDGQELRCPTPGAGFDLVLRLDRTGQAGPDRPKLSLDARPAEGPWRPATDELDLGRYDPGPTLVIKPRVRRFGALRPFDASWLTDVTVILNDLLAKAQDAPTTVWAAEAAGLALDWLAVPVREVAHRLGRIYWLQAEFPRARSVPFLFQPTEVPPDLRGPDLPPWVAGQYRSPPHLRRRIPAEEVQRDPAARQYVFRLLNACPDGEDPFTLVVRFPKVPPGVDLPTGLGLSFGGGRAGPRGEQIGTAAEYRFADVPPIRAGESVYVFEFCLGEDDPWPELYEEAR